MAVQHLAEELIIKDGWIGREKEGSGTRQPFFDQSVVSKKAQGINAIPFPFLYTKNIREKDICCFL